MEPSNLPEENFLNAAILLMAADNALCDDMDPDRALKFARRTWQVVEDDEIWSDGKHRGDCTKDCFTCARCLVESYEAEARRRWDE